MKLTKEERALKIMETMTVLKNVTDYELGYHLGRLDANREIQIKEGA